MTDLVLGSDNRLRCGWCGSDPLYMDYHDREWGVRSKNISRQFEFVVLESAQAGLSWITILKKRNAYREAYCGFSPETAAAWGDREISDLMTNPGIVRNRRKIEASVINARIFLDIVDRYGSFDDFLLRFYDGRPRINHPNGMSEIPAQTRESAAAARELKAMGFRFFGPVIAYSHFQATGIVDDHLGGCWRRS